MKQRFNEVGGHRFDPTPVPMEWGLSEAESSFSRASISFVSPHTGEVWGKSTVREGSWVTNFFVLTKPGVGEGHRTDYGPSGSMLSAGAWMLRQLSHRQLALELLIHCDWAMSRPTNLEEFLCQVSQPSWGQSTPQPTTENSLALT